MSILKNVLNLTQESISEIESGEFSLSKIMHKCIRIARLRNDYENLYILEREMTSLDDKRQDFKILLEISPHFTKDELELLKEKTLFDYMEERRVLVFKTPSGSSDTDKKILHLSINEIEENIKSLEEKIVHAVPPSGLHPLDLYYKEKSYTELRATLQQYKSQYKNVLGRVEHRVHEFLSHTEKQLIFGQINSEIFEKNRMFVDQRLSEFCPEALEQFVSVYKRLSEDDNESRNQALLTCRRILKSLADSFYPASAKQIESTDGKTRDLSDSKYVNRLWQFISDQVGQSTAGSLLLSRLGDIGNRIDGIYDLASKGVHSEISEYEANQVVIQTYLLAGDILRIADKNSSIEDDEGTTT